LQPDLIFDRELTKAYQQELLARVNPLRGEVQEGTIIIRRGQTVGVIEYKQLESLRRAFKGEELMEHALPWLYLGYLLLVIAAVSVLLTFLWLLREDILHDSRKITLLFLLIVLTAVVYTVLLASNRVNMLMVPLCILPLVTRAFFDTRTALFTHVLTMLILGTVAPGGFDFVYMQIIAGMVAIFSIVNMRKRSQLFIAVSLIFIAYVVSYSGLSLLNEGDYSKVITANLVWIVVNCLLTLLSYPLIFFIEKTFRVTSDFTLMELTDFNAELLRELSLKAPGTFQHSLQVANLAEAAIYKIGGNSLLVRVGALYHDIGKMDIPMYFIENQSTQVNPHDELSFDESASVIISHVIRGIEKAKKFKLPDVVIDFIRTHHGTMMVQYFYNNFVKSFPDQIPNEDDFRYPGPRPFSKETAVLMMADSVEAAARSLPAHDQDSIDRLVEKIISHQIESGQFENCDITYREISSIKKIFKRMLTSIYHVRVAYPTMN
jgi:putative nucleotidyltransferase with HDIG domain